MKKKVLLVLAMALVLMVGCSKKPTEEVNKSNSAGTEATKEDKTYKVGIVKYTNHVSLDAAEEGFIEGLRKSGMNVEIIQENANGDISLTTTLAQNLKSENVDLIYTIATPAAQGAKNVVQDTPIIFSAVTDPVGAGLVDTIEEPKTNVTGVSDYIDPSMQIDEFIKVFPEVKTFGVIYNTSEQNSQKQVEELEKKLEEKGLKLEKMGVSNVNDIPQAIASLSTKIDALFAITDNMVASAAPIVSENLLKYNIPSLSAEEGQVKNGLLMSEGVNYKDQGEQAAKMAVKVLAGDDIAKMPVEFNEKNDKVVNENTANRLKIDLNNEMFKGATFVK